MNSPYVILWKKPMRLISTSKDSSRTVPPGENDCASDAPADVYTPPVQKTSRLPFLNVCSVIIFSAFSVVVAWKQRNGRKPPKGS